MERQWRRRKQFIIDKGFQLRYTAKILLIILFATFFASVVVSYAFITAHVSDRPYGQTLFANLLWGIPTMLVVVSVVGVFFSHKLAGPIFRFGKSLERINNGELDFVINIRKEDELKDFKNRLNEMIGTLRNFVIEDRERAKDISGLVVKLKEDLQGGELNQEEIARAVERLSAIGQECEDITSRFKI